MRAVVFPRPDEYELTEVPDPASSPDEVIVSVKATTICATDVKILHGTIPFVQYPHSISRCANVLMQRGLVDVMPLVTHQLPLSDFPKAWKMFLERDGDPIRIMMYP
jgi:threonine dehydrogenase-like Zn-dependent dehydrogenase